jgi:hypothetical protein
MSPKITAMFAVVGLLTALNIGVLVISISVPSKAANAGLGSAKLVNDPDFARAVKSIVENCTVNVDLAKVKC